MNDALIMSLVVLGSLCFAFLVANARMFFHYFTYKILETLLCKPAKNTLVKDSPNQRAREFICKIYGCETIGKYYKLPQATCRRCGHKNKCAGDHMPEWNNPNN